MTNAEKLEAIFELEHGLTEWEIDFCESIAPTFIGGRMLTPKQQSILDRIYNEKAE